MPIPLSEAWRRLDEAASLTGTQLLPIEECVGYCCAQPVVARYDLPRFDNSAMDGYAVRLDDAGLARSVQGTLYAGDRPGLELQRGKILRIMTGAPVPLSCQAVVPQEATSEGEEGVLLPPTIEPGAHIRRTGEDIESGTPLLEPGEKIGPYTLALLASQGITHLKVHRRPRVTILATGNELANHFESIQDHQLYNSNAPMLLGRAKSLGCEVRYLGISSDDPDAIARELDDALQSDLILTSGGVSVGDRDFTREVFASLGMQTLFGGVDLKPGKPTSYGTIGRTHILNLPGNPLAAMINFELFGRRLLNRLRGNGARYPATVPAKAACDHPLKPGRTQALLVQYDGESFLPIHPQSPGRIAPLHPSTAIVLLAANVQGIVRGKTYRVIPLHWELYSKEKTNLINE